MSSKVRDMTDEPAPTGDDLLYLVNDPGGTPADRKVTLTNVATALAAMSGFTGAFAPLGTPRQFKQTIYTPGADITTTSTSYVDIDATNLPALSLTLAVGDVVDLSLTASWGHAASGHVIGIDWLVDQPTSADTNTRNGKYGAWTIELSPSSLDAYSETARSSFTATEAGVHTFKPQWRTSGASAAAIRGAGTYNSPVRHRAEKLGPVTP